MTKTTFQTAISWLAGCGFLVAAFFAGISYAELRQVGKDIETVNSNIERIEGRLANIERVLDKKGIASCNCNNNKELAYGTDLY